MVFSLNQILNVSPNLQIAIYLKDWSSLPYFFLKSMSFPITVPNRTTDLGKDFSLQSLEFYSCIQFEIRKRLCLTVFTTMCPKEQKASDNLIIKDYCLILKYLINLALVVSLGRCLGHINEA